MSDEFFQTEDNESEFSTDFSRDEMIANARTELDQAIIFQQNKKQIPQMDFVAILLQEGDLPPELSEKLALLLCWTYRPRKGRPKNTRAFIQANKEYQKRRSHGEKGKEVLKDLAVELGHGDPSLRSTKRAISAGGKILNRRRKKPTNNT